MVLVIRNTGTHVIKRSGSSRQHGEARHLDAELGAAPVTPLGVVAHGVVGAKADPVRDRPVLPGLLGQRRLRADGLERRLERGREGGRERRERSGRGKHKA